MKIGALGCCLIDYLYSSFSHDMFEKLSSIVPGDGGLISGGLVFAEDLEKFAGNSFQQVFNSLINGNKPTSSNLGGPAIISLIHIAQLLGRTKHTYRFKGVVGNDNEADSIRSYVAETPLVSDFIIRENHQTPTTYVLNDSKAANGKGERSFINVIGAANEFDSHDIPDDFYDNDILILGGTALVPHLHEQIDVVLEKAKKANSMTIVGTIYDYKNEKKNSKGRWPFGNGRGYNLTDLLVCDAQEALRMSGVNNLSDATLWFQESGVGSFIITHGAHKIIAWSSKTSIFGPNDVVHYPVCSYIDDLLCAYPSKRKDTTGCGDNFLGGVIASICMQRENNISDFLDLKDTIIWGGASGGFALMYHGGMFHETFSGEKYNQLAPIVAAYKNQLR